MCAVGTKMIRTAKEIMKSLLRQLPLRNVIVFESNPDYACNAYPVFLQLRKELPDYKMVWCVSDEKIRPEGVDDTFLYESTGFFQQVKGIYYGYFAKAFISCNRVVPKLRTDQVSLFLCHGSKTKKTRGVYEVGPGIDYVNVQSHFFDEIISYEYGCQAEDLVYLGYPRCDYLFEPKQLVAEKTKKLLVSDAQRYVVWLPTFRKHKNSPHLKQMNAEKYGSIGMPLVYSGEDLKKLNDHLRVLGFNILYKPHPAQDISGLQAASLSNIRILSDAALAEQGLQLYEVLAGASGLITDYSSVYFDYLLLDRPIATTTDDIDEWKTATGFAFDLESFYDRSTIRCPDLDALMAFLTDVQNGRDSKASGRSEIRALTNTWSDGHSAKRVAKFIMKKIGE